MIPSSFNSEWPYFTNERRKTKSKPLKTIPIQSYKYQTNRQKRTALALRKFHYTKVSTKDSLYNSMDMNFHLIDQNIKNTKQIYF